MIDNMIDDGPNLDYVISQCKIECTAIKREMTMEECEACLVANTPPEVILWQLKTFAHWGGTQSCTPTKYLLQN
jgi:hypothetical protein